MAIPVIAIVGRPNVGKSTLFNRLVGSRRAITSPVAGTTRDRVYEEVEIGTYQCLLVDTGGLDFGTKLGNIESNVQAQARVAIEEAHLIFFIIDGTEALTTFDYDAAQLLRKSKKPMIFIANKCDNKKSEQIVNETLELGLGEPIQVSAIHNHGIDEINATVDKTFKKMKWERDRKQPADVTHISVVGRPNVGKSSLVNALLGQDRLIVSDIAGTTVDATDTPFVLHGNKYVLIDTAGLRKRSKRGVGLEKYAGLRSLAAISRSDVVCLVLDWSEGLANQDLHVSQYILEAGKGLIVVVNKTDLMDEPNEQREKFQRLLAYRMGYAAWAPVLFVSAVDRKNIFKIIDIAHEIKLEREKRVPEQEFHLFIKTTAMAHRPTRSGHKVLIKGAYQTGIRPPAFSVITNAPDMIHFSYRRYLENEIRLKYGFHGTAIWLDFVEKKNSDNE